MNKSENITDLAAALSKAQGEMEGAVKDSTNPHFKAKYADLASVWDAIRKPLSKHGLSVAQFPIEKDGKTYLSTLLMHSSGQWIEASFTLAPTKNDPQGIGSALTYMKRYALAGVGVAPEDDDGNAASRAPNVSPYTPTPKDKAPAKDTGVNSAAQKWADDQTKIIKGYVDYADLTAWEARTEAAMAKLASTAPDVHKSMVEFLVDQYARLNPLAAE